MPTKLTLPIVLLSIVMAFAFAVQWLREQNRVYPLIKSNGYKFSYLAQLCR